MNTATVTAISHQPHVEPKLRAGEDQTINLRSTRILSAEGRFAANEEQKKMLIYLSDERLIIGEGMTLNPHVQSYMATLKRQGQRYKQSTASVRQILDLYHTGLTVSGKAHEHSSMQRQAMELIADATRRRASDIHIRVRRSSTEVLYRIHGDLVRVFDRDSEYGMKLVRTYYQAMADISEDTFKENARLDARIASPEKLPENLFGVRIATTPTDEANLMVLRLLYNDTTDSTDPVELGFTRTHASLMQVLKESPIGMNIICGPTGSGKSTTLQRILTGQIKEMNGSRHVITVEDPPEYPIVDAIQTPVTNCDTAEKRSAAFSEAIASAMRLDPDTIMIGEIRDKASGQMALRAAMTGHQVWTTLHANSAMAIIDRLVDLGLPINMLADHTLITGLIAQRLVKRLCTNCKLPLRDHQDMVTEQFLDRLKMALGAEWVNVNITKPGGCPACQETGSSGRTVVGEVIIPDPTFMEHIRHGRKIEARKHWLSEQLGTTFVRHALTKIADGDVDPVVAERTVGRLTMDDMLTDNTLTVPELAKV